MDSDDSGKLPRLASCIFAIASATIAASIAWAASFTAAIAGLRLFGIKFV
jgi:hypothetical protein